MIDFDFDFLPQSFLPPVKLLDFRDLPYHLDLTQPVLKSESIPGVIFSLAMETIYIRYPSEDWLITFTSSSKNEMNQRAGSGIYSELFLHYIPLGIYDTSFNSEVRAIRDSLPRLISRISDFSQAVIHSDSQTASLAIVNLDKTPISTLLVVLLVVLVGLLLFELQKSRRIVFQ